MAISLATDPVDDAADKSARWVDRILMVVFVGCIVAMIVFALTRLFS